jgi:hypothetical protein
LVIKLVKLKLRLSDYSLSNKMTKWNASLSNSEKSLKQELSRRDALKLTSATGATLIGGGAAGSALTTEDFKATVQTPSGENQTRPVASRRHMSSVGPVEPEAETPGNSKVFETIDSEIHYLGSTPYTGVSGEERWKHNFVMASTALRTMEFDTERSDVDGSISLFDLEDNLQEISIKVENGEKVGYDATLTGFMKPSMLEDAIMEADSQDQNDALPPLAERIHKSADVKEGYIDEYAGELEQADNTPTLDWGEADLASWAVGSLLSVAIRSNTYAAIATLAFQLGVEIIDELLEDSGSEYDDQITIGRSNFDGETGWAHGAVVAFSVVSAPNKNTNITVESTFGGQFANTQECNFSVNSPRPLSQTDEWEFGDDEAPLFGKSEIGRNAFSGGFDHTTQAEGNIYAEDDGWTKGPCCDPVPKILEGKPIVLPPGQDISLEATVVSEGRRGGGTAEPSEFQWKFVGNGLVSPDVSKTGKNVFLGSDEIKSGGRLNTGLYVRDKRNVSALTENEILIAEVDSTEVTGVSEQEATLSADVVHPEETTTTSTRTSYEIEFELRKSSADTFERVKMVDSDGTGGTVTTNVSDLEPNTSYEFKSNLYEIFGSPSGREETLIVESGVNTFTTGSSGGDDGGGGGGGGGGPGFTLPAAAAGLAGAEAVRRLRDDSEEE